VEDESKRDFSVYYYIKNLLAAYPSVTVVDSFPVEKLKIPSVSVDAAGILVPPYELGNKMGISNRLWSIDVFAETKTQRDELGYKILTAIQSNIPVYDFDEGFPPTITPTIIDYLEPRNQQMTIINVNPVLVSLLYYRANIRFSTTPKLF
jgi:hypothetical protein